MGGAGRHVRANQCSHVDDVLDVEVLQGSHVRVHAPLVLQDNLLEDAVQELPLLEVAAVALVCGTTGIISLLSPGAPWSLALDSLAGPRLVRRVPHLPWQAPSLRGEAVHLLMMEIRKASHFLIFCD